MFKIDQEIANLLDTSPPSQKAQHAIAAIQLLKSGKTSFNEEELKAIALLPGFGTLRQAFVAGFAEEESGYKANLDRQLKALLSKAEYRTAFSTSSNAFHTSPSIADAIWWVVQHLGFNGGKVIEAGAGTGIFLGTAPDGCEFTAIEKDPTAAAALKALYPEATVYNQGYEEVLLPHGSFDLAIGNVPFGSEVLYSKDDLAPLHLLIHNYFLAKHAMLVRPGGLIAILTSTYTLDSKESRHRAWLGGSVTPFSEEPFLEQLKKLDLTYNRLLAKTDKSQDDKLQINQVLAQINQVKEDYADALKKTVNGYLIDRSNAKVRLVGAIRLPSDTFYGNARTEVTADLLVFQRIDNPELANPQDWVGSTRVDRAAITGFCNDYYKKSLQIALSSDAPSGNLLGVPVVNKLYGDGWGLAPHESIKHVKSAIANIAHQWAPCYVPRGKDAKDQRVPIPPELPNTPRHSFCEWGGRLWQVSGCGTYLKPVIENIERVRAFLALRQKLDTLLDNQTKVASDAVIAGLRKMLNAEFDQFCKSYGRPNSPRNRAILGVDPRFFPVQSLEKDASKDPRRKEWVKSDILLKRTSRPFTLPTKAKNPIDALAKSMGYLGRLDLDWMADLLGTDAGQVAAFLHSKDLLLFDPELETWVLREEYLSGDVRKKLAIAKDRGLAANVLALRQVLPLPVVPPVQDAELKVDIAIDLDFDYDSATPEQRQRLADNTIHVDLGATWISSDVVHGFVYELLEAEPDAVWVSYSPPPIAKWQMTASPSAERCIRNCETFGCEDFTAIEIILRTLNCQDLRCYREVGHGSDRRSVFSPEATEAAIAKKEEINAKFQEWLWADKDRAKRLAIEYNNKMNCIARRRYSSDYLLLPAINEDLLKAQPNRPHQSRVVSRMIADPVVHIPHPVGFGKSRCLQMGAMRLKQLRLAQKPCIVVLKSTLTQFADSFRELYPTANLLVAGEQSFSKKNRQLFTSQIATGDWDCVLMTHEQWNKLRMSDEFMSDYYHEQLDALEEYIQEAKDSEDDNRALLKILQRQQKRLEARLKKILDSDKDDHILFEQLGIDAVLIDEFHYFKNLSYLTTRRGVAGLPNSDAQRSQDTFAKFNWLLSNGKRIVTATGTTVSNSIAELFTNMRYHVPHLLRGRGLDHFDAFGNQHIEFSTALELTGTGKPKVKERARKFLNMPELMQLFIHYSDLLTEEDVRIAEASLNKPKPIFLTVPAKPTPTQLSNMDRLAARAALVEAGAVKPEEDNMLLITSDGRKNCLDSRLLWPSSAPAYTKVHESAVNIWRIWKATRRVKALQLVFCDLSTPKADEFAVYNYHRNLLTAMGIPKEQIAFIHEAKTNKAKEVLLRRCVSGDIAVIYGSTSKLGTGVNIQNRAIALHHLDAPWRPSDIEQREGRVIRQGNKFGEVGSKECLIFRYVTEGRNGASGFDSYLWQTLENKAVPITQLMLGDTTIRVLEDIGDVVANFATVKAIASGDPRIMELANLQNEYKRLKAQRTAHESQKIHIGHQKAKALQIIDASLGEKGAIAKHRADAKTARDNNGFFVVKSKEYDKLPSDRLLKLFRKMQSEPWNKTYVLGKLCGLTLKAFVSFNGRVCGELAGKEKYSVWLDVGKETSTQEMAMQLNRWIDSIQLAAEKAEQRVAQARLNLVEYDAILNTPYAKEARYQEVSAALIELEKIFCEDQKASLLADEEEDSPEESEPIAEPVLADEEEDASNFPSDEIVAELLAAEYAPLIVKDPDGDRSVDWLAIVESQVEKLGDRVLDNVINFPAFEYDEVAG